MARYVVLCMREDDCNDYSGRCVVEFLYGRGVVTK